MILNKNRILIFASSFVGCFLLVSVATSLAADSQRPNVLFILTDDQCWETLGCTGGEVETPNLDQLAARGTLFTHAYNMGSWSGAVCLPSRSMFITGRKL